MTHTTRLFDSLPAIADFASQGQCKSCDSKFAGGTLSQALKWTRDGDLSYVAESDKLLASLESLSFPTLRNRWTPDVAGAFPDVGAFLSGSPLSMQRRVRVENESAPIIIFIDLFASAAFSKAQIMLRGAAVLALTRILSAHRPIELYAAFATTTRDGKSGCVAVRLDTTPLDLAHASYVLSAPSFLRQILFNALEGVFPSDPFPSLKASLSEIATQMFPFGTQILAISGVVSSITSDPQKWLLSQLRNASPEILGEAA